MLAKTNFCSLSNLWSSSQHTAPLTTHPLPPNPTVILTRDLLSFSFASLSLHPKLDPSSQTRSAMPSCRDWPPGPESLGAIRDRVWIHSTHAEHKIEVECGSGSVLADSVLIYDAV